MSVMVQRSTRGLKQRKLFRRGCVGSPYLGKEMFQAQGPSSVAEQGLKDSVPKTAFPNPGLHSEEKQE